MRLLSVIAFLTAAYTISSHAADAVHVPSPSSIGTGSSSTTIGVLHDSVSVTLEGSGSVSAGSNGATEASGSVGVPQARQSVGGSVEIPATASSDEPGSLPPAETLPLFDGRGAPVFDPNGDGTVDAAEARMAAAIDAGECAPVLVPPTPKDLEISTARRFSLVPICPGAAELNEPQKAALRFNPRLLEALGSSGYAASDVLGLGQTSDGVAIVYVRAAHQ